MAPWSWCRDAPLRWPDRPATVRRVETPFDPIVLNRHVEGLARAHQHLLVSLAELTDEMVTRSSRLPDWTVGHVLAHLEHQGDSMVRLVDAAESGEVGEQYPGGMAARVEAIERDATRSASDHVKGVRRSIYAVEGAFARARDAWYGRGLMVSGIEVPVSDLPLRRWREVEVHCADLGLAELDLDGPTCWSSDYVREDLRVMTMMFVSRTSMGRSHLPDQVSRLEPAERLAWLLGRLVVDGVEPARLLG